MTRMRIPVRSFVDNTVPVFTCLLKCSPPLTHIPPGRCFARVPTGGFAGSCCAVVSFPEMGETVSRLENLARQFLLQIERLGTADILEHLGLGFYTYYIIAG